MKIPLAGGAYQLRSPAVSAQQLINLYPEIIEDPTEHGKTTAFLYGIPGRHVFSNLTAIDGAATPIRGIFTWAGRCFVAAGTKFMELNSSGGLVGSVSTISNASVLGFSNTPVQMFFNGTQLFVVSGLVGYVLVGSTLTVVTIGDSDGTVTVGGTANTQIDWVSGDKFQDDGSWIGQAININGTNYIVSNLPDPPTQTRLYLVSPVSVTSPPNYAYHFNGYTPQFVTGAYLNDSFFANQLNSRAANFSDVFRGDVWNGLNAISKDTWPDYVISVISNGSVILLFGTDSFDVFQANTTSATTFFSRIDGASSRVGAASPWSPIVIDGVVYFIGSGSQQGGPRAYVLDGYTPRPISQPGQEAVWYANHLGPGCISYSYSEEGHTFWAINFGSQAWAYDTGSGRWHQRAATSGFTAYPTAYHSFIAEFGNGKHLTGGPLDGTIYESSVAFYDDNGTDIYWRHALPFLYNNRNRMYDRRLELECETGTSPSVAPSVVLDYSDDRGHTYGTSESASLGAASDYSLRVFWSALGSYYERVYRFTGHSQGRVALIDCELDQEEGIN